MEIKVKRIARKEAYTIGKMYVDGAYVCDTLEDKDRGLTSTMSVAQICGVKIKGETAIPTGRYLVDMKTVSPRFGGRAQYQFCKGRLPRLCNTVGFQGVLIHIGDDWTLASFVKGVPSAIEAQSRLNDKSPKKVKERLFKYEN